MKATIINSSETFSMGFSYEHGHLYGKDYTYNNGTVVREVFGDDGKTIDRIKIHSVISL
jgi:hypothetical protein